MIQRATFDGCREPFSRFGSWLSVMQHGARDGDPDGWWLCSHHDFYNARRRILMINAVRDGTLLELSGEADPGDLRLAGGALRVCCSGTAAVRLRGEGLSILLEGAGIAYTEAPGRVVLNHSSNWRRYGLRTVRGSLALEAKWSNRLRDSSRATCVRGEPDADGVVEVTIEEFESTWVDADFRAFDDEVADARAEFNAFAEPFGAGPADPSLNAAWRLAQYVLWSATVSPLGLIRRPTIFMSKVNMGQCWSWDHCFNAMALAGRHEELAWDQFWTLFDHQDEHGCLPDAINDVTRQYCYAKPPIHGWAALKLLERSTASYGQAQLPRLYEVLSRWTSWWLTHRRAEGMRLPHYLHGNDSGWDNSTMFDRGVPLVGPDLATFLVLQCRATATVAARLGRETDADTWNREADALTTALVEDLWDGEAFRPQHLTAGGPVTVRCQSLIPLMPLCLGTALPAECREALLAAVPRFVTPAGLATEAPDSECYEANGYWRGPMWGPAVRLVVEGLRESGAETPAADIARRYCATCATSGFFENFDAQTGEGLCDKAYTWTAAVFLDLVEGGEMGKRGYRQP